MMAYLVMMAIRLIELRRVLKPHGCLYLHCDPTASHYLKLILDAVFGYENFRNEIVWIRSNPKSLGSMNFPNCTDTILRYSKSNQFIFHQPFSEHDESNVSTAYRLSDERGHYQLLPLLNPNDNRPNLTYEFLGVTRVWRWTKDRMERAYKEGQVVQAKPGAVPRYKKYLDSSKGKTVTNCWTNIKQVLGNEALGYPTQKPVALLERIIQASSNEGDVVLDPFCGCGTATHAAQKLGRNWIGIDITHLAISLIEKRMKDAFPEANFEVIGSPKDLESAQDLAFRDKYQFQWWAVSLIGAHPYQDSKKGADSGIDGLIYFLDDEGGEYKKIIVSVKGGENIGVSMIRDLSGTMEREKAAMGFFITLAEPSAPMVKEAAAKDPYISPLIKELFPRIQILTVRGLLAGTERPRYPDLGLGLGMFKKSKQERNEKVNELF